MERNHLLAVRARDMLCRMSEVSCPAPKRCLVQWRPCCCHTGSRAGRNRGKIDPEQSRLYDDDPYRSSFLPYWPATATGTLEFRRICITHRPNTTIGRDPPIDGALGDSGNFRPVKIRGDLDGPSRFKDPGFASFPNRVVQQQLKFDRLVRDRCRPCPHAFAHTGQSLAVVPSQPGPPATDVHRVVRSERQVNSQNGRLYRHGTLLCANDVERVQAGTTPCSDGTPPPGLVVSL